MDRALVVIDDSDAHRELLAESGRLARDNGAELIVFSWMTPEDLEDSAEVIEEVEEIEHTTYSDSSGRDLARRFGQDFAEEALDGIDIEFEVSASITEDDELANAILDAAERAKCDHIFLVGRKRSPTGKAIFGDVAQRVLLNFEGLVTVKMH